MPQPRFRSVAAIVPLAVLIVPLAVLATLPASLPPALADEPLPPRASYETTTPDGSFAVSSSVENGLTAIASPIGAPDGAPYVPMWFIPGFHRNVVVAANGASALVLPDGGNLIVSDEPGRPLLTFHRPSKASSTIRLGDIMRPADLERTASHYLWTRGVRAKGREFVIALPRGGEARIDAATGAIVSSPVGPKPQTDERIAGIRVPGREDARCLTYDALRSNLTALGPREPLPDLPPPFAAGCVAGFVDERADRISVFEEGVVPRFDPAPSGVLTTMDPIWGLVPIGGTVPEGTRTVGLNVSTSLSMGSQESIEREAWTAPRIYDTGEGQFRTVSLSGLDADATRAALGGLSDRWAGAEVDFDNVRERTDLTVLPDGTHHLGAVPAGPGDYAMLFEKRDARMRGLQYSWATDDVSCFDVQLEGDGSTARGRLAAPDENGWSVRDDLTFRFGPLSPLRPLPPLMAAERMEQAGLADMRERCLAVLDAS